MTELIVKENLQSLIESLGKLSTAEVLLIHMESISNLADVDKFVPELSRRGLLTRLGKLYHENHGDHTKMFIRHANIVMDKMCKDDQVFEMAYKAIKAKGLVKNMSIQTDLITARHAFSICASFMRQERMQAEFFTRRKEVIESIMDCIKALPHEC